MFEKQIILKEQLAARCLFQCSAARKLPASAGVGLLKVCPPWEWCNASIGHPRTMRYLARASSKKTREKVNAVGRDLCVKLSHSKRLRGTVLTLLGSPFLFSRLFQRYDPKNLGYNRKQLPA